MLHQLSLAAADQMPCAYKQSVFPAYIYHRVSVLPSLSNQQDAFLIVQSLLHVL
uniref:Uncharacterized protein n=1 Tax=Arundo donax TaxID=35708 RepID=A0A0A9E864_ARUDO